MAPHLQAELRLSQVLVCNTLLPMRQSTSLPGSGDTLLEIQDHPLETQVQSQLFRGTPDLIQIGQVSQARSILLDDDNSFLNLTVQHARTSRPPRISNDVSVAQKMNREDTQRDQRDDGQGADGIVCIDE